MGELNSRDTLTRYWKRVFITYNCSVTLQALSETIALIWFDVNIDYLPACQVTLAHPVAKFDKMYLH